MTDSPFAIHRTTQVSMVGVRQKAIADPPLLGFEMWRNLGGFAGVLAKVIGVF
jgi:hypothetical protein